jgi:response regulator of citrate/malate metabolism
MNEDNKAVLIVEDNKQYAMVLEKILKGFFNFKNIEIAMDIDIAFDKINSDKDKFEILFIDYHFPEGKTGGDLLQRLNEHDLLIGKSSFLITAEPDTDNSREALNKGVVGVIAKPFDKKQIEIQLNKAKRINDLKEKESFSF